MRASLLLAACASLALTVAGCAPSIHVRTIVAPDFRLATMHTFSILPTADRRDGWRGRRSDDPMVSNTIANRAIRDRLEQSLMSRGYTIDDVHPDFAIAFYASSRERLDVTVYDYGYPYWPPWMRGGRQVRTVNEYTEGTVIVDAINPRTRELLWRGEGKAVLADRPDLVALDLADAAEAIVRHFPAATPRVIAGR